MAQILKSWKSFERQDLSAADALEKFKSNEYKCELINEFAAKKQTLSVYKSGDFEDLCRGGHCENPQSEMKFFKLLKVAGAYWRGDEKNKMLTRIYGTAFFTKEELEAHLTMLEEAKKRDHKKLGVDLGLFTFSPLVGSGLPLWTPRGTILRDLLDGLVWRLRRAKGYEKVEIPHITKKDLYEVSGHWDKFKDELFKLETREGDLFVMKPMNCPHHTQIFASAPRSYKDLPQRFANTTAVYRDEQSGELSGLSRVRCITQDDAHVFCTDDQISQEILKIWDIVEDFYGTFGLKLKLRLSFRDPQNPDKYLGTAEMWQKTEDSLREIAKSKNVEFVEAPGEAAFYGPKLDFMARDAIGRTHQVATIQLDRNMPQRFNLEYTTQNGTKATPVMIHAAIMGSIERFLSVLIEHYAGAFPFWLSPTQVDILPIGESHIDYATKLSAKLQSANIRSLVNSDAKSIGAKIRSSVLKKTPYSIIIGDSEVGGNTYSIRKLDGSEQKNLSQSDLLEIFNTHIENLT